MRNENLDLAPSSGSESSPSWASNTPRASEFNFDFGQIRTVDDLSSQLKTTTLRPSRSSEVLSENSEEKSTTSEREGTTQFLYPKSSKKCIHFGSGELHSSCSSSSTGGGGSTSDEKKSSSKESKIAKFLRRTQSANEDRSGPPVAKCSGECSRHRESRDSFPLQKIDDVEETRVRRRHIGKLGTDMKFRLGFLKRRHTEGTIHSGSVRPSPEEAQKWSSSFNELMVSKYGQALFKAFLQREFSDENIEFWLAIEDYRKSRPTKLNSKAQKIYNDFIVPQAPKEVNLDALTRDGLISKLAQPSQTTFDQAQKRIQGLLEADAYIRFLKCDLYMELVHPEKYQS